jgi:hypothetical protein
MRNIILDLDSTLIYTCEGEKSREFFQKLELYTKNHFLRGEIYSFEIVRNNRKILIWGVFRPGLRKFIDYCFEKFDNIIVWSAGHEDYVHYICRAIFGEKIKKILRIFSRDYCDDVDGFIVKIMDKLFDDLKHEGVNQTNTVILDDNEETFKYNQNNALHINAFKIDYGCDNFVQEIKNIEDNSLYNVMEWFEDTKEFWENDVRMSVPSTIF